MTKILHCPCCGSREFEQKEILWPELVAEWNLNPDEHLLINRQQGYSCRTCNANLRSMMLAAAIMRSINFEGSFQQFAAAKPRLRLLEMNEAGFLTPLLALLPNRVLAEYPDVDILALPYHENCFDMVVHSETLEHVANPVGALRECFRVLKPGGVLCYTIPIVPGRLGLKRPESDPSYHGQPGQHEYLVHTEYGSDMWQEPMEAGFDECRLISLDYPASIALVCIKHQGRLIKAPAKISSVITRLRRSRNF